MVRTIDRLAKAAVLVAFRGPAEGISGTLLKTPAKRLFRFQMINRALEPTAKQMVKVDWLIPSAFGGKGLLPGTITQAAAHRQPSTGGLKRKEVKNRMCL